MAKVGLFLTDLFAVVACVHCLSTAPSGGIIVDGMWRFTAVTNRLVRLEYDTEKQFVDDPTDAFLRSKPLGSWLEGPESSGVWKVVETEDVAVHYQWATPPGNGTVLMMSKKNKNHTWHWGDDPADGNLRGTARTLDSEAESLDLNCHHKVSPTMDNSQEHCTWGLISKQGWAVVNETGAPVWHNGWYAASKNSTDISVFLHGLDFAGALKDFVHAAGAPTLPPRYALGSIFTRWFDFDSDSTMALIEDFESRSMPLDSWIFDMNWHDYGPWGSFTWNKGSYPRLQEMLDWFQSKGLPIGANTHDHDGISPQENTYKEVCEALGRTPCTGTIPFDLYNKTYAMAQEDIAWRAIQTQGKKQGIDFAWIDYQQGEHDAFQKIQIPKINPTIVLNRLRSTDNERHGENKRSLILSRWGGLGSHKYPLGFSGDQHHSWKGLAYLPYFTSTAANVAFGYWSHDTVGGDHDSANDYELSVRWFQTSAFSPVLRMHDKGAGTGSCSTTNVCARVVPFDLPNAFFKPMREVAQFRERLMPYIYTAAFSAVTTGLTLTRPMYYEDPTDESLYGLDQQYLFGPDFIISPISAPSAPDAKGFEEALGAVSWSLYAPKTTGWVDRLNGDFHKNDLSHNVYGINDVPGLIRQGAVIPLRPRSRNSLAQAQQPLSALDFHIAPAEAFYSGGKQEGSVSVVDDDGITMDYQKGKFVTTKCSYSFEGRTFKLKLTQTGNFAGQLNMTTVMLSFPQLPPLTLGAYSGNEMMSTPVVEYNRPLMGSVITLNNIDLTSGVDIEVSIDKDYSPQGLAAFVGVLGRIRRARYVKDALDDANVHYGDNRANITSYVLAGTLMSPSFAETLPQLWTAAVSQASGVVKDNLSKDPRRSKFVSDMMLGNSSDRVHNLELVV